MIRLNDATRLAITKLRTRKVRLVVTVVIAGLLFSVLAAASQVSRGAFASINDFGKEGFGGRYILAADPVYSGSGALFSDNEVVERALVIHKSIIERKIVEAKRLGLAYDPKQEPSAVQEYDTPQGKQRAVQPDTLAARQALQEMQSKQFIPGKPELNALNQRYSGLELYESHGLPFGGFNPHVLKVLKDGKEPGPFVPPQNGPPTGTDTFSQQWTLLSRDLMKPFMLPKATALIGKDGSIPVIAPYSAVEQLLGLKALPASAKPSERLARLETMRSKAEDIRFEVCYRNQASETAVSTAISQHQEIEKNKTNKDYVKPELLYALPGKACTLPGIEKDSRTAETKKQQAKQDEFDRIFGKAEPQQQILTFRVIGISPEISGFGASGVNSLVSGLLVSTLGTSGNWYTPLELQTSSPFLTELFKAAPGGYQTTAYYAEAPSAATATALLEKESCQPDFSSIANSKGNPTDAFKACYDNSKYFSLYPFGSNSLALQSAKKTFGKFFLLAALGTALIAALIMVGTLGRIIADSRRETAVFRAIGAKKLDIVQVYILYAFFLSLLIFAFALLVGSAAAQYVNSRYSAEFTVQALVAYNAQDLSKTFNLYSFYLPDMLRLLGLCLAGGFISALLPLFRNVRRNPIRDMRDDT